MPGRIPHDMECDVAEVEIPSSNQHQQVVIAGNNNNDQVNDRKRQRLENALQPTDIVIPGLSEKLKNYQPTDQNRFGILGVLADVNIECPSTSSQPPIKNNINNNKTTQKPKWCPPIYIYNIQLSIPQ
ncbi:uncharacterized protein LOC142220130 [Haematobia irritans]|uniref:uncharacterized protein LOC142220130 n=1 Tax=Haematobia irritans TaxID=7368 RepID=UPI003F509CC5